MGLREPREISSKPMGNMKCRKVRMGHNKAKVMKQESKRLVESPWALRMKNKIIGPRKPKRVSKNPWEYRVRKWAKDVQEERNGTKELMSNVMG